jgi:REP element-mobilizing transposase RayT
MPGSLGDSMFNWSTWHALHVHLVWSVVDREPLLTDAIRPWLWAAIAEQARSLGSEFVVVGGMADHVHVLTELPTTLSVAELAQRLKGGSSRLVGLHNGPALRWQKGYGALSVGRNERDVIENYIRNQALHHMRGDLVDRAEPPPQRVAQRLLDS